MKFKFTKIILPIDLAEYHESYVGETLQVWVNPPREKRREREAIIGEYSRALAKMMAPALDVNQTEQSAVKPESRIKRALKSLRKPFTNSEQDEVESLNRKMFGWLIEIWSQHENPSTHWTMDEMQTVYNTDPALYQWLTRRTIEAMNEFRDGQKKV